MTEENHAEMINAANAPFGKLLGVKILFASKDRIEAELEVRPELTTLPPSLHGGAIMALADNLGGVASVLNMPANATTSTIESKTNFLRPIPVGEKALARTTALKIGRRVHVWETRITREDGKLAAIVTQTQIVTEPS